MSYLEEKYSDPENDELLDMASLMDPRFRTTYITSGKLDIIKERAINELAALSSEEERPAVQQCEQSPPKKTFFKKAAPAAVSQSYQSDKDKIETELISYLLGPEVDPDTDPLDWWKRHEPNFTRLSRLARKYLVIPATSTPSERVFSVEQKCRDRWRSLRDVYVKEKKKEREWGWGLVTPSMEVYGGDGVPGPICRVTITTPTPTPQTTTSTLNQPQPTAPRTSTPQQSQSGNTNTPDPPTQTPTTDQSQPTQPPSSTPLQSSGTSHEGSSRPKPRKRRGDSMSAFERRLIESLQTPDTPQLPPPPPPLQPSLSTTDEDEVFCF
ncbi:hypothetical protein ACEWY4_010431 [Coilia grayii]|uniref:HAT C-terminal dimerisation domain-containing protein n=1 Tax=Coilia grayii TaxID=363190 RepID=A0ABD1K1X6_9TELE